MVPGGPAARRPGGPAARRPGGPAARRPGGPAARRPGGPAARRPGGPAAMKCARHPAGARKPAPSTSAGSPGRPDVRTGRARAPRLALLPALALLLGALSLFAAAPAEAQGDPTPPSVPRNVVATAGDKAVTLTWEPPSSWGDGHSRGYLLEVKAVVGRPNALGKFSRIELEDDAYQPSYCHPLHFLGLSGKSYELLSLETTTPTTFG